MTTLTMLTLSITAFAQPEITMDRTLHDYGMLEQGDDTYTEFWLTNTGTEALLIDEIKPACGCTVPEWTKAPILPGDSTLIVITYDSKRLGVINKTATIHSNASNGAVVLRLKGEVSPVKNDSPEKVDGDGVPVADQ